MSKQYPLYDELVKNSNARKEKIIDLKRISTIINHMQQTLSYNDMIDHYEEIGSIILHHESINNNGILLSNTPYDGKTMVGGKGILNDMINFPANLQQIIAEYIEYYAE